MLCNGLMSRRCVVVSLGGPRVVRDPRRRRSTGGEDPTEVDAPAARPCPSKLDSFREPGRKVRSVRLRLVIPAAIAAFATYTALVRDDALVDAPRLLATGPGLAPDAPTEHLVTPISIPPPAPPAEVHFSVPEAQTSSSPYADLAPPLPSGPAKPSVYDLLAGAPMVEMTPEAPIPRWDEAVQADVYDRLAGTPMPEPAAPARDEPVQADPPSVVDEASLKAPLAPVGDAAPPTPPLRVVDPGDPWQVPLDEGRFALGGWAASAGHSMVSAVTFRRRLPTDVGTDQIVLEIDASENVLDGGLVVLSDPGFAPDRDGFTLLLEAAESGSFSAAGSYRVLPAG